MKKIFLALIACATLGTNINAMADSNHTVSMGYAQSKIEDGFTLKGVNVKYRYEWDSPVSVITSFTYMGATNAEETRNEDYTHFDKDKDRYFSLAAGPAYRFNEFISIYGLIGAGFNHYTNSSWTAQHSNNAKSEQGKSTYNTSGFMYGAGIQINPRHNISVDIGYEGSSMKGHDNDRYYINGFNVGVGYRF